MRFHFVRLFATVAGVAGCLITQANGQLVRRAEPIVETPPEQPALPPLPPLPVKRAVPVDDGTPAAPTDPAKPEAPPVDPSKMQVPKAVPVPGETTTPPPAGDKPAADPDKPETKAETKPAPAKLPPLPPPPPKPKLWEPPLNASLVTMGRQKDRKDLEANWQTLKDAPTIKLEVAAPRGQILDRNGVCLAQNRVVYYLGLSFPRLEPPTPEKIIAFGQDIISSANKLLGTKYEVAPERLVQHYKDRRWLPMIFALEGSLPVEISQEQIEKIMPMFGKGLVLHPTYVRTYPKLATACHVIGYTGIRQRMPTGAIADFEPFIEEPMGRAGLESFFEDDLRGKPGSISILFDPQGTKLHEEVLRRPVQGHNVVTTLDYNMQRFAEDALHEHAKNGGAMVIVDVRNGDILAMASGPGYNLNEFVPRVPDTRFNELMKDPKTPMLGRAFQAAYYPASTFKVITSLSGLESGAIDENTIFDCGSSFQIGDRVFHNWNKDGEGSMNVVGAIKRSCNTWFYQAAQRIGAGTIMAMADRMGFGQPVGLPLIGETKGFLPNDAYYQQKEGHKILPGMLASMAIGQVVTATPLQVAQCMASLADGVNMPKLRLVKQVQDYNDNVIKAWPPEVRKPLNLSPAARNTVVKGMIAVVQGEGGTGHNAKFSDDVMVAGKTGTAQWQIFPDEGRNRWLAWFTGFLPANNPVYAFAVVYEGAPGEHVSGGSIAAPIVSEVFDKIYKNAKAEDPLLLAAKEGQEIPVDSGITGPEIPKAEVVQDEKPQAEPPPTNGVGGFFRRLFGGKKN